jgi:HKD family nuclease
MASELQQILKRSNDARIAVAFVSVGGLRLIEDSVNVALKSGAHIEFLVGLDFRVTEPDALHTLYKLAQKHTVVTMYCFATTTPAAIYHPKLYLFRESEQVTAIVGSSNLTEGGLKRNVEVNMMIQAAIRDEIASEAYEAYNRLKFHPGRVVPDTEYLDLYSRLHERERHSQQVSRRDKVSRDLARRLVEKNSLLEHPKPTRRDLVGWLELIYDSLPDGEFTNNDVYTYEEAFRERFPTNTNIRAKVRQQLQVLRDLDFIKHLGTGRWQKL